MKKTIQILLALVMSFPFQVAHAKPPSKKQIQKMSQEAESALWENTLDYLVREYQRVATPSRFDEEFLKGFRPEDRKMFLEATKGEKALPRLERQGKTLLLTDSKKNQMRIEPVDLDQKQFRLNGYLWTYRPKESLREQVRMLQQRVPEKAPRSQGAQLWSLVVPEAHAIPALVLVAVSAAIGALVSQGVMDPALRMASSTFCTTTNKTLEWDTTKYDLCLDWKKRQNEANRSSSGRLDAIEKMIATDQSNVLGKFRVVAEHQCADNNDGKERLYVADVRVKETDHPLTITARFTPEGKATELRVNEYRSDKVLARLQFDDENYLTCALLPNEEAKTDPLTRQNVSLCMSANLTSEEKAKVSFLEDTARFVNLRVTRCNVQAAAEEVAKGQKPASPLGPEADEAAAAAPTASVPGAAEGQK